MTHIYFVRHGLSQLNVAGKIAGFTDTPLVKEGKEQAKQAGISVKKLKIDHIISSPLSRTLETAKIIAKEINYPINKIEVNPLFIERHFGSLEGKPYKPDTNYDGIADAEPSHVLLSRSKLAVDYLENLPYKNILVVSHGSFGRALRHHLVPSQPFHAWAKINNAEIVKWVINQKNSKG
jgi:broad specificity phosphatase PhoE